MNFSKSKVMLIFGIMMDSKKDETTPKKEMLHIKVVIFIHKTVFPKWKFSGQKSVK